MSQRRDIEVESALLKYDQEAETRQKDVIQMKLIRRLGWEFINPVDLYKHFIENDEMLSGKAFIDSREPGTYS